jgi:hypothetical protein
MLVAVQLYAIISKTQAESVMSYCSMSVYHLIAIPFFVPCAWAGSQAILKKNK